MKYSKEIYNTIEKKDLNYLKHLIKNNKIDLSYNNNSFIKKAAECSSIEIFKYLISFPEVDYTYFNWTFKSACLNGNYDIVDFLLNYSKINIFAEEHFAIKMAASNNHFEVINLVLNKYTQEQIEESEILAFSAFHGHINSYLYLLEKYNLNPAYNNNNAIIETYKRINHKNTESKEKEILKKVLILLWNNKKVKNTLKKDNFKIYKKLKLPEFIQNF